MLRHEELVKQFSWGISILTAYLHYNNKINYTDINILSENFTCDLLNILYDLELRSARRQNEPGYDLISKNKKVIVQVSTSCTLQKVNHTFNSLKRTISKRKLLEKELEKLDCAKNNSDDIKDKKDAFKKKIANIVDISGYRVIFFFLCEKADSVEKYSKNNTKLEIPPKLHFSLESDIFCFDSLVRFVHDLSEQSDTEKIDQLEAFMTRNANLFIRRDNIQPSCDKVSQIIDEYSKNFTEPLFLHRYKPDTRVTLKNLFVEPSFLDVRTEKASPYQGNIVELLDSFAWGSRRDRLLFIDGDAAIGKTSLISWLCYHYSELDNEGKSIFCNMQLVCVRLRDLAMEDNDSVAKCILRYLSIDSMEEFEKRYHNALIILEGADELGLIGGTGTITIEQFIINIRHAFSDHKIIITSRPKFIKMEFFLDFSQAFTYQHYSLEHFSKDKRNCWIQHYEQEERCGEVIPQSTRKYISELTDHEASGVADTPLALYLLVGCEINEKLRDNKWALYREIFHNAIRNTPYNESFHNGGDAHYALKDNTFAETVYMTIGKIANRMFRNAREDRFYITNAELDDIILGLKEEDKSERIDAIRRCCVLCAYWKENTNIGALEFYHNNIRDFFMCEYIYQRFFCVTYPTNTDEIIRQLIETACDVFQYGMIAQTTWEQTFSFLYFRLQEEKASKKSQDSVVRKLQMHKLFPSIVYEMINNTTMWRHSFNGPQYESIKSTFLNFVLFLRVWIDIEGCGLIDTFSSEINYDFWHEQGVFHDWARIFTGTVDITQTKHIAFGSQTQFLNMNFTNSDLETACFEESEFLESSFERASLCNANFSGATLKNVNFSGADLHNANFAGATLVEADFSNTNLRGACFKGASLTNITWPDEVSYLEEADFSRSHIRNANWKNWSFKFIGLDTTKFERCSFNRVQFFSLAKNVVFENCSIANSYFTNIYAFTFRGMESKISYIFFRGVIEECSFRDITVDVSNWEEASIKWINFTNAHLKSTIFCKTVLEDIIFNNCAMDSVNLLQAQCDKSAGDYIRTHAKKVLNLKTAKIF